MLAGARRSSLALVIVACRPGAPTPIDSPASPHSADTRQQAQGEAPALTERPSCVDAPFPAPAPRTRESKTSAIEPKAKLGPVACRADREVWRDEQKRIRVCTIARRVTAHGLDLAGDNYTHFHPDGLPYQTTLAREQELETGDGTPIRCAAEHLVLLPDGTVEHCTLASTRAFERATCLGGESIGFRPTGELWHCTIAEPVDALDVTFPAKSRLAWHEGGALASAGIEDKMHIGGWLVRGSIELHPNGSLARIDLDEPRTVAGIELPPFADVWFYSDGRPWHVEYVAERGFMIHGEPWTDTRRVTFDCRGKITSDSTEHYQADTPPPSRRRERPR